MDNLPRPSLLERIATPADLKALPAEALPTVSQVILSMGAMDLAKEIAECAKAQGAVPSTTVAGIERLGALFSERASMILMPVDRMCAGRVKDVHH